MSSICGIYKVGQTPMGVGECLGAMNARLSHRGPDLHGTYMFDRGGVAHNGISFSGETVDSQPMRTVFREKTYVTVVDGELYNASEVKSELAREGVIFRSNDDSEVFSYAYAAWGEDCLARFCGVFAFAVYCEEDESLFLARDRLGVKPLFFTERGGEYRFASEVKALLLDREAVLDREGLWQLFILSPVRVQGAFPLKGIYELAPAECAHLTASGIRRKTYWTLTASEHTLTRAETVERTRELVTDAILRRIDTSLPLACLLSGGLDSSVVTAVSARAYAERGRTLDSYSFTYEDSESFKKSAFQPESDDLYAPQLAKELSLSHTVLRAPIETVSRLLADATLYRDFPGQADIDSSLLYFCGEIKRHHGVVLSGECADEVFGGYPWFYRPEMIMRDYFPWIHDPHLRISLLRSELAHEREGMLYTKNLYRTCVDSISTLEGDSPQMAVFRRATALSVRYFGANLLERKDRMSMAHGLTVRMPFADHRLLEFVYNVPAEIKLENRVEKALLRRAMQGVLPGRVLWRKKSPYPKTHSPLYERTVRDMLAVRMEDRDSILHRILNRAALSAVCEREGGTWQGQLMGTPQLLAWLLQLDTFCRAYSVSIENE